MKVVKCIHEGDGLSKDKIYNVIFFRGELILIINDDGIEDFYYLKDIDGIRFVDATADIREGKLKELGII